MKKLFASVIIALVSASGIFAEEFKDRFTGMLGGGVSVPVSHLKVKDDGFRDSTSVLLDFSAMLVAKKSGFTMKIDEGVGAASVKGIPYFDNDREWGAGSNSTLAFGYSFVRSEDTIFSLCGSFAVHSYDISDKNGKLVYDGRTLKDVTVSGSTFGIGLDLTFVKRLGEHFSVFMDVGAWYDFYGIEEISYEDEHDNVTTKISFSRDIFGRVNATPTLGLCYKF